MANEAWAKKKQAICLDFDGTIYSYISGWRGVTETPDPPVQGARAAIAELRKNFRVVVNSARCDDPKGKVAIENWLRHHNIEVDEVVSAKPGAVLYVDDRGFRFGGSWDAVLKFVTNPKNLQSPNMPAENEQPEKPVEEPSEPQAAANESRSYVFRRNLRPFCA